MVNYGSAEYWDERYSAEVDSPFDWLFSFHDVAEIIDHLIPSREEPILLPGAGNAPFSVDLEAVGGYRHLTNIDLSPVVVKQMQEKCPSQIWRVMNVTDLKFGDGTFPFIVDKSLIDTLLCYNDSALHTAAMVDELYRVLSPGGRFITFSLHSIDEVVHYFRRDDQYDWSVSCHWVKSSRWDAGIHRRRAVAHALIICDKHPFAAKVDLRSLNGILSDDDYRALTYEAEEVS
jgi:EEF1A lysine methyltransferase 4